MKKFGFLIVPLFVALALVLVSGNDEVSAINTGSVTLGPSLIGFLSESGGTANFNGTSSSGADTLVPGIPGLPPPRASP